MKGESKFCCTPGHVSLNTTLFEKMANLAKPVLLIGMMGAGKSTVGRRLAACSGLNFYDLDREIEKRAGKTVPDIFKEDGEGVFREQEVETLQLLLGFENTVIAAGGGVFPSEKAINIWLNADVLTLYERSERGIRPKRGDLQDFINLFEERALRYSKAEIHIDNNGPDPDNAVDAICRALDQ